MKIKKKVTLEHQAQVIITVRLVIGIKGIKPLVD